ncbi:MAG TPA: hypothetical protein VIM57_09095 [Luteolibacter sp.]
MNSRIPLLTLCVLNAATAAKGGDLRDTIARDDAKSAPEIIAAGTASRWRVGASYAPILGLEAKFNGLGAFQSPFTPQPLGGGIDYDYDDGFVHVDSSGNAGGQTWNWGYENDSQYDPSGSGSINFSITNSLSDGRVDEHDNANGFEAFAYYEMGKVAFAPLRDVNASWGFRGGLQYARVEMDNRASLSATLITTVDSFDLGGQIPPSAPYSGSFFGPGVLLSDSPTRSVVVGGAGLITGLRDLDADVFVTQFGSYLEVPLCRRFSVTAEGGVCLGIASGSYDFESSTTVTGLGTQTNAGHDSATRFLPGVYAGLSGIFHMNDDWSLQASGRYQYLKPFELGANGSDATLSFDSAFVVSLGVLYSF